jgi:hypothetical protein
MRPKAGPGDRLVLESGDNFFLVYNHLGLTRNLDLDRIAQSMTGQVSFDARKVLDREKVRKIAFACTSIGRD